MRSIESYGMALGLSIGEITRQVLLAQMEMTSPGRAEGLQQQRHLAQYELLRVEATRGQRRLNPDPDPSVDHRTAETRALGLLMEVLSPTQKRQFESSPERGYLAGWRAFAVIGSAGGRFLLLSGHDECPGGTYWSVLGVSSSGRLVDYCFQSVSDIPWPDRLLSWKLWIEANEPGFRKIAIASIEDTFLHEETRAIVRRARKLTNEMLQSTGPDGTDG